MSERRLPSEDEVALAKFGYRESLDVRTGLSGAVAVNLAVANVHDLTCSGDVVFSFVGAVSGRACGFTMVLRGPGAASFPASVKWIGGQEPSLTGLDMLSFVTNDGGNEWLGGYGLGYA